ncbi:hypothetical protein RDABS01_022463 [Bienertia sinuspersici]
MILLMFQFGLQFVFLMTLKLCGMIFRLDIRLVMGLAFMNQTPKSLIAVNMDGLLRLTSVSCASYRMNPQSYQKFPTCTCTATTEFVKLQESELLYQLYIGLDSKKFGSVVSTLLMQDPAPSLNVAYSRIIADERKQLVSEAHSVDRSTTVGFAVQASTNQAQSSRSPHSEYTRPKCNYCARFGHDREHCYNLHGYPAGLRGRGSTRGGHRFRGGLGGSNGRSFTSNTSRVVLQQLRKLLLKIGLMLQLLVMSNGLSTGTIISPTLLKGDNYEQWSKIDCNNLHARNKLGFLDGTISISNINSADYAQ